MTGERKQLRVDLLPAPLEQKAVIDDLFQSYALDFREIHAVKFGTDGRFHYPHLDRYWQDEGCFPFLVTVDGHVAGFVLVQQGSQISGDNFTWDMAEFFIERAHRRHGIGTAIAHKVWTRFSGSWEVRMMRSNRDAFSFWSAAVREFAGQPIEPISVEKEDESWYVFQFETRTSL